MLEAWAVKQNHRLFMSLQSPLVDFRLENCYCILHYYMDIPEGANEGCPGPKSEMAGKNEACEGCPNQTACQEKKVDPDILIVREKMAKVAHKILILSGKGGVGKSTVSTQLALTLAQSGKRVGLMDIDLCGPSVPRMLGLQGHQIHSSSQGWQPVYATDNLAVISIGFLLNSKNQAVIWRGPRKNGLIKQFLTDVVWGELDYLLIDTPPGTSDEHLSIVQYLQLSEQDGAIIVTTPQQVALSDVRKEISFCKKTNTNIIGMIQNMSGFVCPNCKCQSQIFPPNTGGALALCNQFKIDLLGKMPIEPAVTSMTETGGWLGDQTGQSGLQLIKIGKILEAKFK